MLFNLHLVMARNTSHFSEGIMKVTVHSKKTPTVSLENASTVSIDELASYYQLCKDAYFNTCKSLVDDATFDALEDILRQRSPNHKVLKGVGAQTAISQTRTVLPFWMGSQNKLYPDDTAAFKSWRTKIGHDTAIATAKLDGLSALLVITETDAKLYSRGDGRVGSDWTHHLVRMKHLVHSIKNAQQFIKNHSEHKRVLLRGEVILSRHNFTKHQRLEKWTSTGRNVVSGLLNAKSTPSRLLRSIDIVFYEVVEPVQKSFVHQLEWLQSHHFQNVGHSVGELCNSTVLSSDFVLSDLEPLFWTYREKCMYATDGVVVQCNTPHKRNTRDNPNYSFAFKIRVNNASQMAETTVSNVEWNMSRYGRLKPTVVLQPVNIASVVIERATGYHYKFIHDNGIGKGAVVQIRRCGDVIPNIVAVKKSVQAHLPDVPFTVTKSGIDAVAVNIESCKTYQARKLAHFFRVMEVPRMSEKTVMRFVEHHYSTEFDILKAKVETIQTWDGFGKKSSEQLVKDMRTFTHKASALQWIHAGAVFGNGIGERHLEYLIPNAPDLFQTQPLTPARRVALRTHLLSLHGYQATTVEHLLNHHDEFVEYWKCVSKHLDGKTPPFATSTSASEHHDLAGKVYCFTDIRKKALERSLQARGAKIASTMTSKVSVLVCADVNGSSAKLLKAKAMQAEGHDIQIVHIDTI